MGGDVQVEEVYRTLIEGVDRLSCGVLARDKAGVVLFANRQLLEWLGYAEEEMVGHHLEKIVPPELDELLHSEMQNIESGDARTRITLFQRKDSTTFPVLVVPQHRSPEDRDHPYLAICIDLGAAQTAKPVSYGRAAGLRPSLERIALELQFLGLSSGVREGAATPWGHPDLKDLSEREREVLAGLLAGQRPPAIAKQLHISPSTVRNHLKSIYRRLGVGSQSELIERVRSLGACGD